MKNLINFPQQKNCCNRCPNSRWMRAKILERFCLYPVFSFSKNPSTQCRNFTDGHSSVFPQNVTDVVMKLFSALLCVRKEDALLNDTTKFRIWGYVGAPHITTPSNMPDTDTEAKPNSKRDPEANDIQKIAQRKRGTTRKLATRATIRFFLSFMWGSQNGQRK